MKHKMNTVLADEDRRPREVQQAVIAVEEDGEEADREEEAFDQRILHLENNHG